MKKILLGALALMLLLVNANPVKAVVCPFYADGIFVEEITINYDNQKRTISNEVIVKNCSDQLFSGSLTVKFTMSRGGIPVIEDESEFDEGEYPDDFPLQPGGELTINYIYGLGTERTGDYVVTIALIDEEGKILGSQKQFIKTYLPQSFPGYTVDFFQKGKSEKVGEYPDVSLISWRNKFDGCFKNWCDGEFTCDMCFNESEEEAKSCIENLFEHDNAPLAEYKKCLASKKSECGITEIGPHTFYYPQIQWSKPHDNQVFKEGEDIDIKLRAGEVYCDNSSTTETRINYRIYDIGSQRLVKELRSSEKIYTESNYYFETPISEEGDRLPPGKYVVYLSAYAWAFPKVFYYSNLLDPKIGCSQEGKSCAIDFFENSSPNRSGSTYSARYCWNSWVLYHGIIRHFEVEGESSSICGGQNSKIYGVEEKGWNYDLGDFCADGGSPVQGSFIDKNPQDGIPDFPSQGETVSWDCPDESGCSASRKSPPLGCNESCVGPNGEALICAEGLSCLNGRCVNAGCPDDTNCVCNPKVSLTAKKAEVNWGERATLNWSVKNAVSCTPEGDTWNVDAELNGPLEENQTYSGEDETRQLISDLHEYSLTCENSEGEEGKDDVTVNVNINLPNCGTNGKASPNIKTFGCQEEFSNSGCCASESTLVGPNTCSYYDPKTGESTSWRCKRDGKEVNCQAKRNNCGASNWMETQIVQ